MTKIVNFIVILFLFSCTSQKNNNSDYFKVTGNAQGTTYSIQYDDSLKRNFKPQIDSLLARFDSSLSTYKSNSIISNFNNSDSGCIVDVLFIEMVGKSFEVYNLTKGSFDPSINPLLTFWGFNKEKIENLNKIDSKIIDSLLSKKGFEKLIVIQKNNQFSLSDLSYSSFKGESFLKKPYKEFELNFNAVAQGYSVDLISTFLKSKRVNNYMVELGGEMRVLGENVNGNNWRLGIDKPLENGEREIKAVVNLKKGGLATSGNYRKYYIKDGKKYAHTIDPKTGYPVTHNLLSATVISDECWMADALATACMVNGIEWSKSLPEKLKNCEVYLIYNEGKEMKSFASNAEKWQLEEIN